MMRTESHAPDRTTTLTFPAASIQYQLSIMTLVTHMLLTVPTITARQSWNVVRDHKTHQHTLQLILATIILRSYHDIWASVSNVPFSQPSTTTLNHTANTR